MLTKLYQYIEDVENESIKTGIEIKQAVQRFQNDLKRTDIYFDESKVLKVITFIQNLKHTKGQFNNQNFILEKWQCFILSNIFGWYITSTRLRRFRDVYIEISRKQGKTFFASAIALYCLVMDGESSAEVVMAANSREQARVCFAHCKEICAKLDSKQKYIKAYRNEVKYGGGLIKCVAANADKNDGHNLSCLILDEYHAAPNSLVYNVLRSSMNMRAQPISIIITTAGFSKSSPCYEFRQNYKNVLQGLTIEDRTFIAIYTLDEGDDWQDEKNWIKAAPNLDVTINKDVIKEEINKALNNVSQQTEIKTKVLNIWCDVSETWIPDSYIQAASQNINIDNIPATANLFCSVDLSSTSDITSVTYSWINNDIPHFINHYYLPEDSFNTKQDKERYKLWHKQGYITLTEGNVCDYKYIINDILTVNQKHNIVIVGYDSWNSTFFVSELSKHLNAQPYSQGVASFNKPTKEFERLILSNKVVINSNPITNWMFQNVVLRCDSNGNAKPDKSKTKNKIDGVITILQNLGLHLLYP